MFSRCFFLQKKLYYFSKNYEKNVYLLKLNGTFIDI